MENRARTILDSAAKNSEFRKLLIEAARFSDEHVYPDTCTDRHSLELLCQIEMLDPDGGNGQAHLDELSEWLRENVSELAYHVQRQPKPPPGARFSKPVGAVFLSWTVKLPRERAAMTAIMKCLDYLNIDYFDYTQEELQRPVGSDQANAIRKTLQDAVARTDISVELMSTEIGGKWVDYERHLISQNAAIKRILVALEHERASHMTLPPDQERRSLRIDMSGGRSALLVTGDMDNWSAAAADTGYYRSELFFRQCFDLGSMPVT